MTRVHVIAEDGWVALDELVSPEQLTGEEYRKLLAERILWATEDVERREQAAEAPVGR